MRGIMDSKKGQVSLMNIAIGVIVAVMVFSILFGVMPDMTNSINEGRNQDGLNCKSGSGQNDSMGVAMYNASRPTNNLSCLIAGYFLPYFFISVLIGIGASLAAGRIMGGNEQRPVESYPQY
jgi:hypothetical protein